MFDQNMIYGPGLDGHELQEAFNKKIDSNGFNDPVVIALD